MEGIYVKHLIKIIYTKCYACVSEVHDLPYLQACLVVNFFIKSNTVILKALDEVNSKCLDDINSFISENMNDYVIKISTFT